MVDVKNLGLTTFGVLCSALVTTLQEGGEKVHPHVA